MRKGEVPMVAEFTKQLADKMASLPTLLDVLKAVQADESLWHKLVLEIDRSDELAASDFLHAFIVTAESTGDLIEAMAGYEIIRVALHNAIGCTANPKSSIRPDLASVIPCTHVTFRIVRTLSLIHI